MKRDIISDFLEREDPLALKLSALDRFLLNCAEDCIGSPIDVAPQAAESSAGQSGDPLTAGPDSALPSDADLRRAYEETVDPMFDRYDEEDWS